MVTRVAVLAACVVAFTCMSLGCGQSEADILKSNAEMAAKAKMCDKCGLMSIPDKHDCGKSAFCGACLGKCQTDKKAWPGEASYDVDSNKLAKCKACQASLGMKK